MRRVFNVYILRPAFTSKLPGEILWHLIFLVYFLLVILY